MSNHVHIVVGCPPNVDSVNLSGIIGRSKSFTAKQANKIQNEPGRSFWSDEHFDTTVRRGKFTRVMWYVLNNPVKTGLVDDWRKWDFTWLNPDYEQAFR